MAPNQVTRVCDQCKGKCNSRTKVVFCDGNCKKCFHIKCASVSEKDYHEIVELSEKLWFCKICKLNKTKQRESLVSLTPLSPLIMPLTNTNSLIPLSANRRNENDCTLATLNAKMDQIIESNNSLRQEINHLKIVIEDYKKITENIIQSNVDLQNENTNLKWKIINVQYNVDSSEQQTLSNNLLISGIEQKDDENINDIIIEIANKLDVTLTNDDIEFSKRNNKNGNESGLPPDIIINFKNKENKIKIMKNKKTKTLNTKMLDSIKNRVEHRAFYINEQLIRSRRYIHKKAREAKKNNYIKYAWVNDGEVYVRKTDTSKIIKLKDISQLDGI